MALGVTIENKLCGLCVPASKNLVPEANAYSDFEHVIGLESRNLRASENQLDTSFHSRVWRIRYDKCRRRGRGRLAYHNLYLI